MADLEAFASRVAHDLRNPLQTIQLGVPVARIELLDALKGLGFKYATLAGFAVASSVCA